LSLHLTNIISLTWGETLSFFPRLRFQPYEWRGLRQTRGLRSKARRVLSQFSPHDWTAFKWEGTASLLHYCVVVMLLTVFLAAELNPFYLKVGQESGIAWHLAAIDYCY